MRREVGACRRETLSSQQRFYRYPETTRQISQNKNHFTFSVDHCDIGSSSYGMEFRQLWLGLKCNFTVNTNMKRESNFFIRHKTLPAHCSSPEIAFAERCPPVPKDLSNSGNESPSRMPETLNPFLAFSSEDLKGMDKVTEAVLIYDISLMQFKSNSQFT